MLVRRCLVGAIVGMSGGFIVGLVGAFVLGPIWMIASEGDAAPPVNLMSLTLLLTIPAGVLIGIMVPIRKASRRRQEAKAEEEARLRRHKDLQ
ncbi:hypothetical protein [Candidatus Methylomirabilis sp.]|uniref:Uncharacterized protein n=1 Tax=Candidatus Methylomirabilis tolerans TaxID=3123416 RepID=A0AAJ1AJ06_9BACT|nr:hypothetical protein [Candidatus Methylomirabilis sp.]